MIWIFAVLFSVGTAIAIYFISKSIKYSVSVLGIFLLLSISVAAFSINIDITSKTTAIETWSGTIEKVYHKEEWDEWHEPTEYTTTDSDGHTTTHTTPGYWEHHSAVNWIKTTDGGTIYVNKLPDGKVADDYYINTTKELEKYFPIGSPSASIHTFENKVQTSYSVYKTNDVDETEYSGLPEYMTKTENYIEVNRFIGFKSNGESNKLLSEKNSWLNKDIPDPEKEGKTRSWKQVNLSFVNLGNNKSQDWGFALENKWQRGAKNDLIISLSTDESGKVLWCYPISWSESELCKIEIRNYVCSLTLKNESNYKDMINKVSDIVAEKFVRKEFADFSYISVPISTSTILINIGFYILLAAGLIFLFLKMEHDYL